MPLPQLAPLLGLLGPEGHGVHTAAAFVQEVEWRPDPSDIEPFARSEGPTLEEVRADVGAHHGQQPRAPPDARPLPCVHGTDWGHPCPVGWRRRLVCEAPQGYNFTSRCTAETGGAYIPVNLGASQKQRVESACSVTWPCAGEAAPDYDQICPESWSLLGDGSCAAPAGYAQGQCPPRQNFLHFTPGMKAAWAESCGQSWPWKAPGPPPDYSVPAQRPRSAPANAVWASCKHDYGAPCPMGFRLDGSGMCQAPPNYAVKQRKLCASADTYRFTAEMKQAFEKACQVVWPCKGDLYMYGMGPLAGLAAFL